jgi:inosine-uridine nucleoside N-ribohydrolase
MHGLKIRIVLFPVLLLAAVNLLAAAHRPIPVVLDTDIGGDIDDALGLALVLASPELELRAVTTVSGDTSLRARIAARMMQAAGRPDIPLGRGVYEPCDPKHQCHRPDED